MEEIWKPVQRDHRYQVSNLGRLKGLKGRLLKGSQQKVGYVTFHIPTRNSNYLHREILVAFYGEPPEGSIAVHKNGNRQDNRLSNLTWEPPTRYRRLTAEQVAEIRSNFKWGDKRYGYRGLAHTYGLGRDAIKKIVTGKTYRDLPLTPTRSTETDSPPSVQPQQPQTLYRPLQSEEI